MRSKLYLKSVDVTSRSTGGANLMPFLRWKVYVVPPSAMPPLACVGTSVARSGSISVPAEPDLDAYLTKVSNMVCSMAQPWPSQSMAGSRPWGSPW